jgi:phosphoglycerol transferase MdoB-like AlkP superfamily enzyme
VLWHLFDVPQWSRIGLLMMLAAGTMLLVAKVLLTLVRLPKTRLAGTTVAGGLVGVLFFYFEHKLIVDVKAHLTVSERPFGAEMWSPQGVAALSRQIGPIPFLLYTRNLEQYSPSLFFNARPSSASVSVKDFESAASEYFSFQANGRRPNVVLVQLESIFNPNWAFALDRKVRSFLFEESKFSRLVVPMHVNITGGGSWVTEFEALTGLDSRLFGYAGYYTHASVGPYIEAALPAYLRRRGYVSAALYPATGVFFNVRNAYGRYGFDYFWDSQDLALSHPWAAGDIELAQAFVKKSRSFGEAPFFSYIVTNGAHSPYPCRNFRSPADFFAMFDEVTSSGHARNCVLNEYLRLMYKAEKAVKIILDRLIEIENTTTRPFVLMVYGDHQPHSFVRGRGAQGDYDDVRTAAKLNQTFMHLFSSAEGAVTHIEDEIPASLLPTILSSFVADRADDLYLSANVHLYQACGSDLYPATSLVTILGSRSTEMGALAGFRSVRASAVLKEANDCAWAQKRTISFLRNLGIVRRW